jgi:hypothetical protein
MHTEVERRGESCIEKEEKGGQPKGTEGPDAWFKKACINVALEARSQRGSRAYSVFGDQRAMSALNHFQAMTCVREFSTVKGLYCFINVGEHTLLMGGRGSCITH